jgi:DNA-binding transcriptional regulator YiaG
MASKIKTKKDPGLKAFSQSLKESVKYAKGQKAQVKAETVMIRVSKEDVKQARQTLGVSQPKFAALIGYSPEAVKKWEQDKYPVPGGVVRWIEALRISPKEAKKLLLAVNSRH